MPRPRTGGTRERILEVALELFASQGLQQTSLREIADRLGITKPALYYHFSSRDDLVRSLVQPLVDDVEAHLAHPDRTGASPRELLGDFFDLTYRHRAVTNLVVRELSTLGHLDLGHRVIEWRTRLMVLLTGPEPTLAAQTRAIVAVGGLADCTIMFEDVPREELRTAALDAACAALGLPAGG